VNPLPFVPHPDLAVGFDAADLVGAGGRTEHLPPLELVDLPAEEPPAAPAPPHTSKPAPPARGGGEGGGSRIPTGERHRALVERLCGDLLRRDIEPGAADGWRRISTGELASVSPKELAGEVWFDLLETQGLALQHIQHLLEVIAQRKHQERRAALIGRLTGKPATAEGAAALAAWVRAVTGREDAKDVRVMAHWLWLVKRLATGQRTEWDIMPIVFGREHGSGKSTATERLVAPVEELATTINAADLTDDRRYRQLHVMLVGRWEEMSGSAKAEIEALKHTVTAPEINYRELATHSMVVARRTMSFIGTSNNSVDVMVSDTTGARRFYQLDALPRLDHGQVNAIDPATIWRAVSEGDSAPIHEVITVVREAQAGLVHRDAVSMWLEAEEWATVTIKRLDSDQPFTVHAYDEVRGCDFEDLAARFKRWCNEVGQAAIGVKLLAQRLKQEGWTRSRPAAAPGQVRGWKYHKPPTPAPVPVSPGTEIAPTAPAAPPRSTRHERMHGAEPSPNEDAFGSGGGAFAFE
jgi:hypothetical protein